MTAGRDFLLLTIRGTAPERLAVSKWWLFFGGVVWGLIILAWVIL